MNRFNMSFLYVSCLVLGIHMSLFSSACAQDLDQQGVQSLLVKIDGTVWMVSVWSSSKEDQKGLIATDIIVASPVEKKISVDCAVSKSVVQLALNEDVCIAMARGKCLIVYDVKNVEVFDASIDWKQEERFNGEKTGTAAKNLIKALLKEAQER